MQMISGVPFRIQNHDVTKLLAEDAEDDRFTSTTGQGDAVAPSLQSLILIITASHDYHIITIELPFPEDT